MADLGTLGGDYSYAYLVSSDGSVVAGQSYTTDNSEYHAFRWTSASGMADLGTLGGNYSYAQAMNSSRLRHRRHELLSNNSAVACLPLDQRHGHGRSEYAAVERRRQHDGHHPGRPPLGFRRTARSSSVPPSTAANPRKSARSSAARVSRLRRDSQLYRPLCRRHRGRCRRRPRLLPLPASRTSLPCRIRRTS